MIVKLIEEGRKTFTDQIQQQVLARAEENKLMAEKWKREEKKRDDEMKILIASMDFKAKLRIEEIKREDKIREQEKDENKKRWEAEMMMRKEELAQSAKDREESRNLLTKQMQHNQQLLLARNSATFTSKSNVIFVIVSTVVAVMMINSIHRK